jgi:hypothetical protein
LGILNYVSELYSDGEITVREAAEILQLSFRQTAELLEKEVGGNVNYSGLKTGAFSSPERTALILGSPSEPPGRST